MRGDRRSARRRRPGSCRRGRSRTSSRYGPTRSPATPESASSSASRQAGAANATASPVEEGRGARVGRQQFLDFDAQLRIATTRAVEERRAPYQVELERRSNSSSTSRHRSGVSGGRLYRRVVAQTAPSSRASQARALRHSLLTVRTETSSAVGDLGLGHAAEELELDDALRRARSAGAAGQCLVEGEQHLAAVVDGDRALVERQRRRADRRACRRSGIGSGRPGSAS